jgi:hypothetical protein
MLRTAPNTRPNAHALIQVQRNAIIQMPAIPKLTETYVRAGFVRAVPAANYERAADVGSQMLAVAPLGRRALRRYEKTAEPIRTPPFLLEH